jgi:hypothetical protein
VGTRTRNDKSEATRVGALLGREAELEPEALERLALSSGGKLLGRAQPAARAEEEAEPDGRRRLDAAGGLGDVLELGQPVGERRDERERRGVRRGQFEGGPGLGDDA